jgi:hypothetical protein
MSTASPAQADLTQPEQQEIDRANESGHRREVADTALEAVRRFV